LTTASTAGYPAFREYRFLHWICAAMALVFALAAYRPDTVFDFFLENGCVAVFLIGLTLGYRKMPLSGLSYLLILVYLGIHEWGAHYKYSDVPLGEWLKPLLHTKRNMYDRVAHFSFGLLLSYPLQEMFMRGVGVNGRWRYILPVEAILSFSAIYEILEAGMAMILSPQRGEEFVGMQGDMWDSQEDMLMAGLGSLVAMIAIALVRRSIERRRAARAVQKELALYRAHHG
jgi:putative membrane protein